MYISVWATSGKATGMCSPHEFVRAGCRPWLPGGLFALDQRIEKKFLVAGSKHFQIRFIFCGKRKSLRIYVKSTRMFCLYATLADWMFVCVECLDE